MFSTEKIKYRFNRTLGNFSFHLGFWFLSLAFYVFITGQHHIFMPYVQYLQVDTVYLLIAILSIIIALVFTLIDMVFGDKLSRLFPIKIIVFLKTALYFISAFLVIVLAALPSLDTINKASVINYLKTLPQQNMLLFRFLVFFYLACFFNSFFRGAIKKVGGGNFKRWVFGFMNKPHEEERIFMFIDLKDSTKIAEKTGHEKFGNLVQDVFNDLSMVDNYKGEIYQYLGDGAIISWEVKKGLRNNNCLNAFFAFSKVLQNRRRYYQRKYQLTPQFKAGVHVGKVMVLQVGQIRRDISYNGDTMNTTARIESKCNEFRQNLLISSVLYEMLPTKKAFRYKNVGEIPLRGKRRPVEIFGVKQKS